MPEFLFIIRDMKGAKLLSPDEIQSATVRTVAWMDKLKKAAMLIEGRPLENRFRLISERGKSVAATALPESAERITAFLLLQAEDFAEAEDSAKSFPTLNLGSVVEIYPVVSNS